MKENFSICIIQARMGSSRLPGKSLMKIAGAKALIHYIYDRVRQCQSIDKVIIATSDHSSDDCLLGYCHEHSINIARGSENDLIKRYFDVASSHKADIVVRIPADNPLVLPQEIDRCVQHLIVNKVDYASNLGPYLQNRYPDGLGAEVMTFELLEYLDKNVFPKEHREHVTSFLRDESHHFSCSSPTCPPYFSRPDVVLDINTLDEFNFMNRLVSDIEKNECGYFPEEIIKKYDEHFVRSGYARK